MDLESTQPLHTPHVEQDEARGHDPYNHTGEAFTSYERNERAAWAALKRTLCSHSLPHFFKRQAS